MKEVPTKSACCRASLNLAQDPQQVSAHDLGDILLAKTLATKPSGECASQSRWTGDNLSLTLLATAC